jgi:DNA repair exonuclease SbcCD ATPase subunit
VYQRDLKASNEALKEKERARATAAEQVVKLKKELEDYTKQQTDFELVVLSNKSLNMELTKAKEAIEALLKERDNVLESERDAKSLLDRFKYELNRDQLSAFLRNQTDFVSPGLVMVVGVVGRKADLMNGVYEPTGDMYNGKPLFRKRNDREKWLRFSTNNYWCFSPTQNKEGILVFCQQQFIRCISR